MISFRYLLFLISGLIIFISCSTNEAPKTILSEEQVKEPLIDANKKRLKVENRKIEEYLKRRKWDMELTGSGLRYLIYEKGGGEQVDSGKTVVINYNVNLMDGTQCYSSDIDGTKGFVAGKGEVEDGLDEGVFYMQTGDKAKFILPSHLAYGLMGDGDKVPSHSVLVYDVELIDIK